MTALIEERLPDVSAEQRAADESAGPKAAMDGNGKRSEFKRSDAKRRKW